MQRIIWTVTSAAMACLLMGCVTKHNPARTEVTYPGVGTVTYHCPPGQRKQGRCL